MSKSGGTGTCTSVSPPGTGPPRTLTPEVSAETTVFTTIFFLWTGFREYVCPLAPGPSWLVYPRDVLGRRAPEWEGGRSSLGRSVMWTYTPWV